MIRLFLSLLTAGALQAQPSLEFSTFHGGDFGEAALAVAVDNEGAIYATGLSRDLQATPGAVSEVNGSTFDVFVVKLDPTGSRVIYNAVFGGSGRDRGTSIAVDRDGAVYVGGVAFSADFPVTAGAAQSTFGGGSRDGFIAKLSADGSQLVYSTFFGGSSLEDINALVLDDLGRAYVAGATASDDMPTTADAIAAARPSDSTAAFLARVSPTGDALEYSSYLGGSRGDEILALSWGPRGRLWAAGFTASSDFPIPRTAIQQTHAGVQDAFVLGLIPTLTEIQVGTYFGGSGDDRALALTTAIDGVFVAGRTLSRDLPTTASAIQPAFDNGASVGDAFVARFDIDLSETLAATYLGGSSEEEATGIAVDRVGNIYLTGWSGSPNFPLTADAFQGSIAALDDVFLVRLEPDASTLDYATFIGGAGGEQGLALAVGGAGAAIMVGTTTSPEFPTTPGAPQPTISSDREGGDAFVTRFDFEIRPRLTARGIVNAASILAGTVAPGEIFSIFGRGMGPAAGVGLQLDGQGLVSKELGGTRVLINGDPAALTFASDLQVNAVVTYAVAQALVARLQVERDGVLSNPITLRTAATAPAIFTLSGTGRDSGAILNQDLILNSSRDPAERGAIAILFATGEGATDPPGIDGRVSAAPLPRPLAEIRVFIGGIEAEVLYAGAAPGLVAGVLQINLRVPANAPVGAGVPIEFQAGVRRSQPGVTVAIR